MNANESSAVKNKSFLSRILAPFKFGIKLILLYTVFSIFFILFFRFILPPTSAFIYSNIEEPVNSLISTNDIKYKPVPLSKISLNAPLAVIASEDQLFFEHYGFDFEQIEKALKENSRRKRIRGASTISMQVAKNLFLWSDKNFIRKGLEVYYTLLIETLWSKKRIIEVYLNIAEMGKGIYGVQAASEIYYRRDAFKLNMAQSAALAAVLPRPKVRNPKRPSSYLIRRTSDIIRQMNMIGGTYFVRQNLE